MTSRPETGPIVLPADPKAVADDRVAGLASLGTLHKPPTEREYEHAALEVALTGASEEDVFAVLAHLDTRALSALASAAHWLESAADRALSARLGPNDG